jgi:hypothetical protein
VAVMLLITKISGIFYLLIFVTVSSASLRSRYQSLNDSRAVGST